MIRKIAILLVMCLVSISAAAHDYPVLYDVDDLPIGPVLSIVPLSAYDGSEAAQLLSPQGYRALMWYTDTDLRGADDYVGWNSYGFFESSDCTGDPIILPTSVGNSLYSGRPEDLETSLLGSLARNKLGMLSHYKEKDMVEYQGELFYVPSDAERDGVLYLRSIQRLNGICRTVDRCDEYDVLTYVHLANYPAIPEDPPPGGWCEGDEENPAGQIVRLSVFGYRLSSLFLNDPEVTGFESTPFHHPLKIRYSDISKKKKK